MKLFEKYSAVAKDVMGVTYNEILNNPKLHLGKLLEQYGVDEMIDIGYCLENMSYDRLVHIINLFLSGKAFFEKLKGDNIGEKNKTILYEWELLSLVHDISYIYETVDFSKKYLNLYDICSEMRLNPFFFKTYSEKFYSEETYVDYFKYKREQFGVCDHGILASILFENRFTNCSEIKKTELAHVIAAHNIFVANRNNVALYKKYGLFELIPDDHLFNCIACKKSKYSYLYLYFCLLDILEPINAFDCNSVEKSTELLNSIDYEATNESLVINVGYANQIETIAHRIFDIPIWLKVGLNITSDKKIIIRI